MTVDVIDLISIFGRSAHQLPVEQHVADDGFEDPAVVHALELDLDESCGGNIETHGQLKSVTAKSRCQVAETVGIQGWQFWCSAFLLLFFFFFFFIFFLILYTPVNSILPICPLLKIMSKVKVTTAVWLSGNALMLINVVALRRARLVLGWVPRVYLP